MIDTTDLLYTFLLFFAIIATLGFIAWRFVYVINRVLSDHPYPEDDYIDYYEYEEVLPALIEENNAQAEKYQTEQMAFDFEEPAARPVGNGRFSHVVEALDKDSKSAKKEVGQTLFIDLNKLGQ